jgi:hypothetical protein
MLYFNVSCAVMNVSRQPKKHFWVLQNYRKDPVELFGSYEVWDSTSNNKHSAYIRGSTV